MKEKGKTLVFSHFRGRIHPDYYNSSFIQAVSNPKSLFQSPACRLLFEGRNRVWLIKVPLSREKSVDIVIKEFRIQGIDRLKSIFFASKASKAWKGSNALVDKGIGTPSPVAYIERRNSHLIEESYFLSEMEHGTEEIRFLFPNLLPDELRRLLESLAEFMYFCHKKGILHRDLSDGNILVRKEEAGHYGFFLIDTNRIHVKSKIFILSRIKNLIRLGIPYDCQRFFLERYLNVPHVNNFLWLWYRINKGTYAMWIRIKKSLRLRYLARKLKIQ